MKKFNFLAIVLVVLMIVTTSCGGGKSRQDKLEDALNEFFVDLEETLDDAFIEDLDIEETGSFTADELHAIYESVSEAFNKRELGDLTYEEVRDKFFDGVDGELDEDFTSFIYYKWYMIDGKSEGYGVNIHFDNETGKAIGIGNYLP